MKYWVAKRTGNFCINCHYWLLKNCSCLRSSSLHSVDWFALLHVAVIWKTRRSSSVSIPYTAATILLQSIFFTVCYVTVSISCQDFLSCLQKTPVHYLNVYRTTWNQTASSPQFSLRCNSLSFLSHHLILHIFHLKCHPYVIVFPILAVCYIRLIALVCSSFWFDVCVRLCSHSWCSFLYPVNFSHKSNCSPKNFFVCVCVCVWERARARDRDRERYLDDGTAWGRP